MDAVHEAEQALDIGVCLQHNRVFECYCQQCYCMICPSCLMFDSHKGHSVCHIEQGAKNLRQTINEAAKEGLLKFQKTQTVLLDVRHAKLSLQENLQIMKKTTQQYFDVIIKTLKARRAAFLAQINQFFMSQLESIESIENSWLQKQQICQKVLKLQSSNQDLKIMQQAQYIVDGINKLSQQMDYQEINLIENIENSLTLNKQTYSYQDLKESFKNFVKKGPVISNKIRC